MLGWGFHSDVPYADIYTPANGFLDQSFFGWIDFDIRTLLNETAWQHALDEIPH
jgi:hypothetical protein